MVKALGQTPMDQGLSPSQHSTFPVWSNLLLEKSHLFDTNKYVHAKPRQAKDKGDKDPIELLSEGADQNPCTWLNKWEDTTPDEMKVFVAHLIVMEILKKNSLEQYWSRDSILNTFLVTTCPEIVFKTSCGIFTSAIQMRPTHWGEKQMMILCFWLGQWWTWCKGISIQSTGQERKYLWMKAHVLLRAESISSVTTPKSQTGSILNFLWSVNQALATFVALKFIQEMHRASHRVMHRKYRMHQKLHALS